MKLYIRNGKRFEEATEQAIYHAAEVQAERALYQSEPFNSPDKVSRFLRAHFAGEQREHFTVLFCNNQNQLIAIERLFSGTIDSASVYPREVVKSALHHNSNAIILAHNHPSGIAEPSTSDRQITKRIVDACALLDIRVLDHMVIGDDIVSFAERGWI